MEHSGEARPSRLLVAIGSLFVFSLVAYELWSGLQLKKIGIPGVFEIEFQDKPPNAPPSGKMVSAPDKKEQDGSLKQGYASGQAGPPTNTFEDWWLQQQLKETIR